MVFFLTVLVVLVYAQTLDHRFVNYDDPDYVSGNSVVRSGLSLTSIVWAFTTVHVANWIPLTWISHMVDVQLFGEWTGGHHLTSMVLHLANCVFLFFLLQRITGAFWRSAIVAALFALHPLHVESVAWIAERKDLLSALFWFFTLWAYLRWLERRSLLRYSILISCYCAGFMAKPMIITLPLTLLLLDFWPLRRWGAGIYSLVREKILLFMLSGVMAVVTYLAQHQGGAVVSAIQIPLRARLQNVVVAYATYLGQFFWPARLAVFYPFNLDLSPWTVAGGAMVLAIVTTCVYKLRRFEYLIVGWLWFLITLVPVIGLVQVGAQAHADRYMYVPMIGLLVAVTWAAALFQRDPRRTVVGVVLVAVFAILGTIAHFQVREWRDSQTLFNSAIRHTSGNYVAYNGLGLALGESGRTAEAVQSFEEALHLFPEYPDSLVNISDSLMKMGRTEDAARYLGIAILVKPSSREAHVNFGAALLRLGRYREAVQEYEAASALAPEDPTMRVELGKALIAAGQPEAAAVQLQKAIGTRPDLADAHYSLGISFVATGQLQRAREEFAAAATFDPSNADAHFNLGTALGAEGRLEEAIAEFQAAIRIRPSFVAAHLNLGKAFANLSNVAEALREFSIALRLDPVSEEAAAAIQELSPGSGTRK